MDLNPSPNHGNDSSPPDSPTFNTDQLPHNTSDNYSDDDEAEVDRHVILDEPDLVEEEEDGEVLFNDNYLEDYRELNEQDQYESLGLDDNDDDDERDVDQVMQDRRAAEMELDARDGHATQRILPRLLHDQGVCPDMCIQSFRKYTTFKKDYNGLLLHLLRGLVKDAVYFEELVSGSRFHQDYVGIKVEELHNKAQEHEIYDLKPFFSSPDFSKENFELVSDGRVIRHWLPTVS